MTVSVTIKAKCVYCGTKYVIPAVATEDHPMCSRDACGGPLVPIAVVAKTAPRKKTKAKTKKA